MKNKLLYWSITVALAGFLFGFDTVVISGAEQELQKLWNSSDSFHGWVVVSSALWGTVVGAMLGGIPTDKIGRKNTLLWIGFLYTVSAIGSAFANDPWVFAAFRFIGGLGVGASTIAAPAYISEIAPAHKRGQLVALYQFNIVLGILIAFISNSIINQLVQIETWRWMIGVEALPAIIYTLMVLRVPKSPRWVLLESGDSDVAREILSVMYDGDQNAVETELRLIRSSDEGIEDEPLFQHKYRVPIALAFFVSFFNQFSGINAFLYYAPRIFEEAGLGESTALLSSIGIGITNLVFTLLGVSLIDKLGRKQLLYIGSYGYIVALTLVSVAFALGWKGLTVPIFLFIFIAAHAIGQGTVIWVFISEIFPNHLRAKGQSFGVSIHWILAALIPAMIPFLFGSIGAGTVFAFFAVMMVLQLAWVWKYVPETRLISLEQMKKIYKN